MKTLYRDYLYRRLKELNMSHEDFAFKVDLNCRYVARLLAGQRGSQLPVLTWFKIAAALDWNIEELLTFEKDYQEKKTIPESMW